MSTLSENLAMFNESKKMFKETFEQQAIDRMYDSAVNIIEYALAKKTWHGFTGNAQTSFTIGIYRNGNLNQYVNGEQVGGRKALRKKIQLGKRVYLKRPFEGEARAVNGQVETTNEYATDTALDFLKSFKAPKGCLSMCIVVGVEYYMFLEFKGYGMLTYAYIHTGISLNRLVFKQIKI